jgi:glucose/arabinose dehydrogenase
MKRPALILGALLAASTAGAQAMPLERILLPPGFTIQVYASGLRSARGLAFSDTGTLFVGSKTGEVYAVPAGGGKARVIAEGLDMPVGAPCNVCESQGDRYANILRLDLDGRNLELFASGVRDTVGFDWHPQTGALYVSDDEADAVYRIGFQR